MGDGPRKKSQNSDFWDQPVSTRRMPGKGYTRFVRGMRLLLPLVALGMLGLVVVWPQLNETEVVATQEVAGPPAVGKNELINPRFESEDSQSQPFTITATRAVQSARDPELVQLEKPMADITLKDGTWLAGSADSGFYQQEAEKLMLEGSVKLYHDDGYEILTEKLFLDIKSEEAWSDTPVYGQGPAGTLTASGVRLSRQNDILIFTGPAKLVLNRSIEGL